MRFSLLLIPLVIFPINILKPQTPAEITMDSLRLEYIRKYKDIAMDEMERSGIPASIKLAQGILESRAGTSELALNASNHFGIKCGNDWKGPSYQKHDDDFDKQGKPLNSCFRKYKNVADCYADHSEFIRNPEKQYRYGFLFELDPLDYKAWAQGLQDAGYSVAGHYAERLIYFIELYKMYEFDRRAVEGRIAPKRMVELNGVKMVQARAGETLRAIANEYNIPLENLQAYNDNQYTPDQQPGLGTWVFIQQKQDSWNGTDIFHPVQPDQTLFDIAQRYGIRLESLRQRNGLKPGQEPAAYEYIRLQGTPGVGETVLVRPLENSVGNTQAKSPNLTTHSRSGSQSRIVVEMLPEEKLDEPVPAYIVQDSDADTVKSELPKAVSADAGKDAEPLIIIDSATGETRMYHTVQKGDTLYSIARRFDVNPERIRQLNQMADNTIRAGQSLRVF